MLMDMRTAEIAEDSTLTDIRKEYAKYLLKYEETKEAVENLKGEIETALAQFRGKFTAKYPEASAEDIERYVQDMMGELGEFEFRMMHSFICCSMFV